MTIKNKILTLLARENLTSPEISEKLDIKSDKIWIYLNTLFKENKVERITDKKPYVYQAITPLAYLIRLVELMGEKMDYSEIPNDDDFKLVKEIGELIK